MREYTQLILKNDAVIRVNFQVVDSPQHLAGLFDKVFWNSWESSRIL